MARSLEPDTHEAPSAALPIQWCRQLLGSEAEKLTDQDVDALRRHAETMAHILIDMFTRTQRKA